MVKTLVVSEDKTYKRDVRSILKDRHLKCSVSLCTETKNLIKCKCRRNCGKHGCKNHILYCSVCKDPVLNDLHKHSKPHNTGCKICALCNLGVKYDEVVTKNIAGMERYYHKKCDEKILLKEKEEKEKILLKIKEDKIKEDKEKILLKDKDKIQNPTKKSPQKKNKKYKEKKFCVACDKLIPYMSPMIEIKSWDNIPHYFHDECYKGKRDFK